MMRADLHVHSLHSGARHYRRAGLRDSYALPEDVYDAAKAAGMDLVTLTDRDTIEGCLRLIEKRSEPRDFVVGEEVEASLPDSPLKIHLNVWGITEAQHREITRLRANLWELIPYLKREMIACCFNHFVGVLPVDLPSAETYWGVLSQFGALEVRNGAQGRQYNDLVAALAVGEASRRPPVGFIGGSDAHTLRRVGTTWTEAPAESVAEFLESIRKGCTAAGGRVRRRADIALDIGSMTVDHYASLWRSLGRRHSSPFRPRDLLAGMVALPVQVAGAPLIGTVVYFLRVRNQVRALQREIAALDLCEFREKMRDFPRPREEAPGRGILTGP
jgi:hypothetical protein